MNRPLTTHELTNYDRLRRLRDHHTHMLSPREHTDLIERGEAIRREWHAQPIPAHRALTVINSSPPRVQREAVRSPTHAPQLAPRLPTSEQQAPIPTGRESAGEVK